MIIDFTNYEKVNSHVYGGSNGKKMGIKYNNEIYMLKFPSIGKEASYSNSVISEYISCHIFSMIGFNAQETLLGTYTMKDKTVKMVCACKDFVQENHVLQEFAHIKNSFLDSSENGYGTELSEVLSVIEEQNIMNKDKLYDYFWDMFVVDSFLGNFDRHNGNWGFLYNLKTDEVHMAPIYDCGSCLYPQPTDDTLKIFLEQDEKMEERIYVFPNSALKINGERINPYQYINSLENKDLNEAILRTVPKIDMKEIEDFILNVPMISDIRKEFYIKILNMRYEIILKSAYEKIVNN